MKSAKVIARLPGQHGELAAHENPAVCLHRQREHPAVHPGIETVRRRCLGRRESSIDDRHLSQTRQVADKEGLAPEFHHVVLP
jgi:hypothetical protein